MIASTAIRQLSIPNILMVFSKKFSINFCFANCAEFYFQTRPFIKKKLKFCRQNSNEEKSNSYWKKIDKNFGQFENVFDVDALYVKTFSILTSIYNLYDISYTI